MRPHSRWLHFEGLSYMMHIQVAPFCGLRVKITHARHMFF